ncbi:MAG: riboflavin synthase [candidate division Zixibacteria bacterium]|nr:riboflavin synthase [candidate division Zixibacteria bacterium]
MFTGLVREIGTVTALRHVPAGLQWTIRAPVASAELHVGDSINVAGACHTVESVGAGAFTGTSIPQTLHMTTFARWHAGQRVNLELPLRADDRFGGHFVSGHVDAIAEVRSVQSSEEGYKLELAFPPRFDRWVVDKGSIAIDGVSMTIAEKRPGSLTVALIPETLSKTTLGDLRAGGNVNIEFDMLVKAVVQDKGDSRINAAMLANAGW